MIENGCILEENPVTYRVWWGDESEEHGEDIKAYSIEEAAEAYAEQCYRNGDGETLKNAIVFSVRVGPDDVRTVEVGVDWDPSFSARQVSS